MRAARSMGAIGNEGSCGSQLDGLQPMRMSSGSRTGVGLGLSFRRPSAPNANLHASISAVSSFARMGHRRAGWRGVARKEGR